VTSKFSHRRTRVQHKPKVCISKKPPTPAALPGYTVTYSFHADTGFFPPPTFSLTRSGTIVGTPGNDHYLANGLDDSGNAWDMDIYWPASPGTGTVTLHTLVPTKTWSCGIPGYINSFPFTANPVPWSSVTFPTFGTWQGSISPT
jgi:hypothetical protein